MVVPEASCRASPGRRYPTSEWCADAGSPRGQLAVNIIFENDNIVTLGEGQHRALAGIRHDKTLRVIAVRHQDNAFDRPLLQRQLQRFDTDPAVRIGRDLNGFDPQTFSNAWCRNRTEIRRPAISPGWHTDSRASDRALWQPLVITKSSAVTTEPPSEHQAGGFVHAVRGARPARRSSAPR